MLGSRSQCIFHAYNLASISQLVSFAVLTTWRILNLKITKMIIATITLCIILWLLLKDEFRKIQLMWNINGPKAYPIIGNGLDLINKSTIGLC
jgi:hypothetical protein